MPSPTHPSRIPHKYSPQRRCRRNLSPPRQPSLDSAATLQPRVGQGSHILHRLLNGNRLLDEHLQPWVPPPVSPASRAGRPPPRPRRTIRGLLALALTPPTQPLLHLAQRVLHLVLRAPPLRLRRSLGARQPLLRFGGRARRRRLRGLRCRRRTCRPRAALVLPLARRARARA